MCLEGCYHVVLAPRERRSGGRHRSIDCKRRQWYRTVQSSLLSSPPEQSRNLNWGPVLQASLIRAPATSGLIGKGLA